jgi:hypothetical protein
MPEERYDPPYRCGFNPSVRRYAEYVAHIEICPDRDCVRRLENRNGLMRELGIAQPARENAL